MEISIVNKPDTKMQTNMNEDQLLKETSVNIATIIKEDTYGLFKVKFDEDIAIKSKQIIKKIDESVSLLSTLKTKNETFKNNLEKIKNENRIVISKLLGKLQ